MVVVGHFKESLNFNLVLSTGQFMTLSVLVESSSFVLLLYSSVQQKGSLIEQLKWKPPARVTGEILDNWITFEWTSGWLASYVGGSLDTRLWLVCACMYAFTYNTCIETQY